MKKISVLTGTRAEYSLLKPVMEEIEKHPQLRLQVIVTGMHLSEEFGHTVDEIKNDGLEIEKKIKMIPEDDSSHSMAKSIGEGITRISDTFNEIKPDILIVLGDRTEALAGTIAAAYVNIAVGHIHGGDKSKAGLDESARHAITKFAHIHFPATQKSAERISKLGEEEWRINEVGAPGLDTALNMNLLSKEDIKNKFDIDLGKPLLIVVQHPVSTQPEKADVQIEETLKAIKNLEHQTIIIYPNADSGGRKIIDKIKQYEKFSFIRTYENLSHKDYLSLLKYADVLVGNSSSGIIESPSFNLPVVNIGIRQDGRERSKNIIDVDHDKKKIKKSIEKSLFDDKFKKKVEKCDNPYGDGKASKRIVRILEDICIDEELLQKSITY